MTHIENHISSLPPRKSPSESITETRLEAEAFLRAMYPDEKPQKPSLFQRILHLVRGA